VVEDADGLLRFVGRDDEMIKSAGNRISPTEIEEAVLAGGEAFEAAAFGVPDARLGQASGTPNAAASKASPPARTASSISVGLMRLPALLIISSSRPTKRSSPSASSTT